MGVTDHVTAVFAVPWTDAVNCADCPAGSVLVPPPIETLTVDVLRLGLGIATGCVSNTVAEAVFVGSARLVAEIVTCNSPIYENGAR